MHDESLFKKDIHREFKTDYNYLHIDRYSLFKLGDKFPHDLALFSNDSPSFINSLLCSINEKEKSVLNEANDTHDDLMVNHEEFGIYPILSSNNVLNFDQNKCEAYINQLIETENFELLYEEMLKNNKSNINSLEFRINPSSELIMTIIHEHIISKYDCKFHYSHMLIYQLTIYKCILHIIKDSKRSEFANLVVHNLGILKFDDSLKNNRMILTEALNKVIMDAFSEYLIGESTSFDSIETREFNLFIGIIVSIIIRASNLNRVIQNVLINFAPSDFVLCCLKSIVDLLKKRVNAEDAFSLLSECFDDEFIYNLFPDNLSLIKYLFEGNNTELFPYVTLRCVLYSVLQPVQSRDFSERFLEQFSLNSVWCCRRSAKVIAISLVKHFYDSLLTNNKSKRIVNNTQLSHDDTSLLKMICHTMSQHLNNFLSSSSIVQYFLIEEICKLLEDYNFYPSGVVYTIFDCFYSNNILSGPVIHAWINSKKPSPGKNQALLELSAQFICKLPPVQ